MKKLQIIIVSLVFSLAPLFFASAQLLKPETTFNNTFTDFEDGGGNDVTATDFEDGGGNDVKPTSTSSTQNTKIKLENPLSGGGINDIPSLIQAILKIAMVIGVPVVALGIIYAGFQFVAAQGNKEKLEKAKETIKWVLVGAVLLLGAWAIAEAVAGTIEAIRG